MMRSMFAGVSGTRAHQVRMDVIGNNIANVNTVGYKYGRATFQDMLSQTVRGSMAPTDNRGGVDPMQVGLGTMLRSIDIVFTPGNLESTGKTTDMAIQGNGFFVVRDSSGGLLFTRDGAFKIDAKGNLVHPSTGYHVQGWKADDVGDIDRAKPIEAIDVPLGTSMSAQPTSKISFVGNLDNSVTVWVPPDPPVPQPPDYSTSVPIYDSQGTQHTLIMEYRKTGVNEWKWTATFGDASLDVGSGTVKFKASGQYDSFTGIGDPPIRVPLSATGPDDILITPDFSAITQVGDESSVSWSTQNGYPAGSLETFNIDDRGIITGVYSNGQYKVLGQMVLASFANSEGLMRQSNNMYAETTNSGAPQLGEATKSGRGAVLGTTLEMSNVDLAREFTDMIVTQRGFQANSRVITAADEMLQELLALKR
jgi:flagellar hook protein FlgE